MSKRYGRRQKRKHRQRIAELEQGLAISDSLLQLSESSRNRAIRRHDKLVKRLMSAFGPLTGLTVEPRAHGRIHEEQRVFVVARHESFDFDMEALTTFEPEPLQVVRVEVVPEDFGRLLHCRVRIGDSDRFAYAVSGRMLRESWGQKGVAEYAASQLYDGILRWLKKSGTA